MMSAPSSVATIAQEDALFVRRAVLRLSSIEFWERYSFYNMFALLPLFVAAPVTSGGMGWSKGDSLRFFGLYLLVVALAPIAGGYVSDHWLSGKRALRLGAIGLLLGHGLMAGPNLITWLVEHFGGIPMTHLLQAQGIPLGLLTAPASLPHGLELPYQATTISFYGAVLLVALGNGLFKPVLTFAVGRLPHPSPAERDAAFTTYFLFLNMGGLLATLVGGWLAQAYGWGWTFAVAALGMAASLVLMAVFDRLYIRPFLSLSSEAQDVAGTVGESAALNNSYLLPTALITLMMTITCIFSYQAYGFVNLFTANLVSRTVAGFEIPTSWFIAANPITIMLLTPVFIRLWRNQGLGHDWSATTKFATGFMLMTCGFAVLAGAAVQAQGEGKASPLWVIAFLVLIGVNELLTTPAAGAAVTRLPPPRHQKLAIGVLTAAAGIGAWLSGKVGARAMESSMTLVLMILAGGSLGCGALLLLLRRRFARLAI